MKILVTGFDPFGGEKVNPAYEAVKLLPDTIAGAEIIKLEIPTVFSNSGPAVEAGIQAHHPDVVLNVGQAGGRACVTIERVAINLAEARIPDNAGEQPMDEPLQAEGPAAYFTTLPIKAMVERIRGEGLAGEVSNSAGTFVCNEVMYRALHHAAGAMPHVRCGFIHVPYIPRQTAEKPDTPSMELEDIVRALAAAVGALAETE